MSNSAFGCVAVYFVNLPGGPYLYLNPKAPVGGSIQELLRGAELQLGNRVLEVCSQVTGPNSELVVVIGSQRMQPRAGERFEYIPPPQSTSSSAIGVKGPFEMKVDFGEDCLENTPLPAQFWRIHDPVLCWWYLAGDENLLHGEVRYLGGNLFELLGSHFEQAPQLMLPDVQPNQPMAPEYAAVEAFIRRKPEFTVGEVVGEWTRQPTLPKPGYLGLQLLKVREYLGAPTVESSTAISALSEEEVLIQLVFASREAFGEPHPARQLSLSLGRGNIVSRYSATFKPGVTCAPLLPDNSEG